MEHLGEFILNHWILSSLFVVLSYLVFSDSLNRKLSGLQPVNVAQAVQLVNQHKGAFVDIREASEFEAGHIAESIHIPLQDLEANLSKLKRTDQALVLVCASGQRARAAGKALKKQGYSQLYILSGGLNSWKEAKLPLFT
jgi:rhodanese-related sulfurtransferase